MDFCYFLLLITSLIFVSYDLSSQFVLFFFFFVSVSFVISDKAKVSGFLVSFWCSFAVHAPLGRVKGILPTSWNWTRVCRSRLVGRLAAPGHGTEKWVIQGNTEREKKTGFRSS